MGFHITGDPAADKVLDRVTLRAARGDDARPAVPDGAGLRGAGEGARALRVAGPGGDRGGRPRGVRRPVRGTAGSAPVPGVDGGPAPAARRPGRRGVRRSRRAALGAGRHRSRAEPPAPGAPGFGKQKAQIFTALLGKRLEVRPDGWETAAGDYAEPGSHRSVADVVDQDSLERVRPSRSRRSRPRSPREMARYRPPVARPGDGVRTWNRPPPCHNGGAALDVNGPCRARQPLYER